MYTRTYTYSNRCEVALSLHRLKESVHILMHANTHAYAHVLPSKNLSETIPMYVSVHARAHTNHAFERSIGPKFGTLLKIKTKSTRPRQYHLVSDMRIRNQKNNNTNALIFMHMYTCLSTMQIFSLSVYKKGFC